jgi:outer membrane receptor for ferrienterochelin and colicin
MTDFFGTSRSPATVESLEPYGLPDDYVGYDIITKTNIGDARVDGLEVNYSQSLGFISQAIQGIEVFGNCTSLRLLGPREADFSTFVRRIYNWGVSYARPAYSIRLNWSKRGRQRGPAITGTNIPDNNYQWTAPFTYLDINGDYRITKRLKVYGVIRNATSSIKPLDRYNPATPEYAKRYYYGTNPVEFSVGVKGEF